VAALGFIELAKHLDMSAIKAAPTKRLRMQGVGYVRFALTFPGRLKSTQCRPYGNSGLFFGTETRD
jgi:hypothetical protein